MLPTRFNNSMIPTFSNDFNDLFEGFFRNNNECRTTVKSSTSPAVNIVEKKDAFEIQVAAPGLDKKDFEVSFEDKRLTISSSKEIEKLEDTDTVRRREFSYSTFKRSFTIPENLDASSITAEYKSGILNVTVPKKEQVKKEAINIKIK